MMLTPIRMSTMPISRLIVNESRLTRFLSSGLTWRGIGAAPRRPDPLGLGRYSAGSAYAGVRPILVDGLELIAGREIEPVQIRLPTEVCVHLADHDIGDSVDRELLRLHIERGAIGAIRGKIGLGHELVVRGALEVSHVVGRGAEEEVFAEVLRVGIVIDPAVGQ